MLKFVYTILCLCIVLTHVYYPPIHWHNDTTIQSIPTPKKLQPYPSNNIPHTGALFALKRKKLYEAEIDKIANIKMTLETQVMNLESAAQNAATMQAMKTGTSQMKKIRQETDIDQVDDLMDEIKEEMEMADEISNALAQPVDPLMADEDDLLAELQELEAEDVTEQLLEPMKKMELPDVPSAALPSIPNATKEEEAELKKLEAELAGLWFWWGGCED